MCHLDTLPSRDATGITGCGDKRGFSRWLVRGQFGRPILDCLTLSVRRRAASLYAGQVQQLGGANPLPNLMEVKG